MRPPRPILASAGFTAACTLAAAACASGLGQDLPPVPSTQQLRPTTPTVFRPDRTGETVPGLLAGSTTSTSVPVSPGRVTLTGSVKTRRGDPIPNALVHFERFVGDAIGILDVRTGPDGRFRAERVLAGRVRVRAWRVPDYVQITNEVLFAVDGTELDLVVEPHSGTEFRWVVAPNTPYQGQFANVAVQIAKRIVSETGVKQVVGAAAVPATLTSDGPLRLVVEGDVLTSPTGVATFSLRCDGIGSSRLQVELSTGERAQSDPIDCGAPPTTPPPPSIVDVPTVPPVEVTSPPVVTIVPGDPLPTVPPTDPSTVPPPDAPPATPLAPSSSQVEGVNA